MVNRMNLAVLTVILGVVAGPVLGQSFPPVLQATRLYNCADYGTGCGNAIPSPSDANAQFGFGWMDASSIFIPDGFRDASVGDLNVSVAISHTFDAQLRVWLEHIPTGTRVSLWNNINGDYDDFDVTLDEDATDRIDTECSGYGGMNPCHGTFTTGPAGQLNVFNGLDPTGEWRLTVEDFYGSESGQLLRWSLTLELLGLDSDFDGVMDFLDACPMDPDKSEPGVCGCHSPDTDSDGDGIFDCYDQHPGEDDTADVDGDGVPDVSDGCHLDPDKVDPGACGCFVADADTDGDGVFDCDDQYPGQDDTLDTDGDGEIDANDGCPNDPDKVNPGTCGCGVPDEDGDGDGYLDCEDPCGGGLMSVPLAPLVPLLIVGRRIRRRRSASAC